MADAAPKSGVVFQINAGEGEKAISPFVYGMGLVYTNQDYYPPQPYAPPPNNIPLFRIGGDDWTPSNWTNNATNHGAGWHNQNSLQPHVPDDALDSPGGVVQGDVQRAFAQKASIIVTVPMLGYVAADTDDTDVTRTPDFIHTRFKPSAAKKGAPFGPGDPAAPVVYQDEFVQVLEGRFPDAHKAAGPTILYSLDNEPDLWRETHSKIHDFPTTYQEMFSKTIDYSKAIKTLAPQALVMGPVTSGWAANVGLAGAPDAGQYRGDFLDNYIAATKGWVDVLDTHYYPAGNLDGKMMDMSQSKLSEFSSPAARALRVQLPRTLWDPGFLETGWESFDPTDGEPLRLIPRLQEKIDRLNPGMKIAITEYYFGASMDISGGIAQADALGIFGREGVFAANVLPNAENKQVFLYAAFNMFRNFNGKNGEFGNVSIPATTSNVKKTSIYASTDAGKRNRLVLVAINKGLTALNASIQVNFDSAEILTKAEVYQLTASTSAPQKRPDIAVTSASGKTTFPYTLPAMSVTTMVLKP